MYGVVLWSDQVDRKAVIWCEDHGDLAFYSGQEQSVFDGPQLDAGDFVQFQLSESQDVRVALEPQLVAEKQYHGLAESLKGGSKNTPRPAGRDMAQRNDGDDNIIAFAPRQEKARLAS